MITLAPDPSSAANIVSSSSSFPDLLSPFEKGIDKGGLEGMEFGSFGGVPSAVIDSSSIEPEVELRVGRVVRDIRYWKPWQPPLSTWIRSARFGFES